MKRMIGFLMMYGLFTIAVLPELAFSQGLTGKGVRVGLNLPSVSGSDGTGEEGRFAYNFDSESARYNNGDPKIGFSIGGFLTYGLNEKFAIQPEIIYSIRSNAYSPVLEEEDGYREEIDETFKLSSIDIPVLCVFSVAENIDLLAGPFWSILLDAQYEGDWAAIGEDGERRSYREDLKEDWGKYATGHEFGLVLGGAYPHGQFSIGARYSMGLTSIAAHDHYDDDENIRINIKVQTIQLLGGYSF